MSPDDLTRIIESHEFAIRANAASDFRVFLRTLWAEDAIQSLRVSLASGEMREALVVRVQDLADREVDSRYENPWDVALSAYVLVLHEASEAVGRMAAIAAESAQRTWWISRLIQWVLPSGRGQAATFSSSTSVTSPAGRAWTARSADVMDLLIQASPVQNARVSRLLGSVESTTCVGGHDGPLTRVTQRAHELDAEAAASKTAEHEVTLR